MADYPRSGQDYPRSVDEFQSWFPTEAVYLDYLEWLRWPEGFICPECALPGGRRLGDGRFQCAAVFEPHLYGRAGEI